MSEQREGGATLTAADLIPDSRLDLLAPDESIDRLGHESIATRVAELLVRVPSSTNVALFAPWGAGKSSFYALLKRAVEGVDGGATVIRYDAWRTSGESFQTHFLASVWDSIAEPGKKPPRSLYNTTKTVHLDPIAALKAHQSLLWGVLVGTVVLWLALSGLNTAVRYVGENPAAFGPAYFQDLQDWFGKVVAFGLAIVVAIKLVDLAKVSIDEQAPSRSEQFAEIFREYVHRVRRKPLIVFVDELDRCSATQVLDVLSGLRTFLETENCSFVVAVDRAAVNAAIKQDSRQARPIRAEDPYYSTPSEFLDKIFQHQISLPPKRNYTLRAFAGQLIERSGGLWRELREADDRDIYQRVLLTLTPAHVKSPRRIKVLLNSYAMSVRTSQGRGLVDWLSRADEIAFWSTLRVEFPHFADDLLRVPDLVDLVLDPTREPRSAVAEIVARWRRPDLATPAEAANELMDGSDPAEVGDVSARDAADMEPGDSGDAEDEPDHPSTAAVRTPEGKAATALNEQLLSYLRRTVEQVAVPGQDLVWMMEKSDASDVGDPALRASLELAVDRESGWVAARFAEESAKVKRAAVRRLANKVYEAPDRFTRDPNLRELALISAQLSSSELDPVAVDAVTAIGYCLSQGTKITAVMAPGVLHLTAGRSGAQSVTDAALTAIRDSDSAGGAARLAATGLETADPAISLALLTATVRPAGGTYEMLDVLEVLPLAALRQLAQDSATSTSLTSPIKRPAIPRKPDVAGLTQQDATTATDDWQQKRDEASATRRRHADWVLHLLESTLANEDRGDAVRDRAIVSVVIEFAAAALWTLTLSRDQARVADLVVGSLDRLSPDVRNRLLLNLSARVRERTEELTSLLVPDVAIPSEVTLKWAKSMVSQILEEDWDDDIAAQIWQAGRTVRSLTDQPEELDKTAIEYDRLGDTEDWDEIALERHLAAQQFLGALVTDAALAGTKAAENMHVAYRELPDPGARGRVLNWVDLMPLGLVLQLHDFGALDPTETSAERRDDLLLRLRCERRAAGDNASPDAVIDETKAVEAADILALDDDDQTVEVVDAWIGLQRDWDSGGQVYREARAWPSNEAVTPYAERMPKVDRSRCFAWTANHKNGPDRLLRLLGARGIDTEELRDVWAHVRDGDSRHEERARDVSKVRFLSPDVPGVIDLWVEVFDALDTLHRGVDLNVAGELALDIASTLPPSDAQRLRLAGQLRQWVDDQPSSHMLAATRNALVDAELLPRPPSKGLFGKLTDQFRDDS